MKNDFAYLLSSYYLTNVSHNTIISYRDSIVLLPCFINDKKSIPPERRMINHFSKEVIVDFLNYLETEKNCSITTRNQRLAGIHSLFRFIVQQKPEELFRVQHILSVPCILYHKYA
jgi:integrase/recombinase XerD